jgi:GTP cyclohydrolase I
VEKLRPTPPAYADCCRTVTLDPDRAAAPESPAQRPHAADSPVPPAPRPAVDLEAAARAIEAFLTALGHPPASDPELRNTGELVAKAFHEELLAGYDSDPAVILRETLTASGGDLVLVRDIAITCVCPHHLLPASGVVHIGYVPGQRIVGLGALARLAHAFSRRLILQETLCEQIAEALVRELGARGAACIARLTPACLTARGERATHASVITTATAGELRSDSGLRAEFFAMMQGSEANS